MSVVVNIKHKKETKIGYKFLLARANFEKKIFVAFILFYLVKKNFIAALVLK